MNADTPSLSAERNIAKGFEPDEPIHEFFGCFTLKQAKKSLFGSTRFHHVPVYLIDEDEGVNLPIVIDLAQAKFHDGINDVEMPDWYFEGWILNPGTPGVQRVRIYVSTMDYDKELSSDDIFQWQMIVDRTKLPLDASIRKLKLDERTKLLLLRNGITTVGDAVEYSRRHNFGDITMFGPVRTAELTKEMEAAGHPLM